MSTSRRTAASREAAIEPGSSASTKSPDDAKRRAGSLASAWAKTASCAGRSGGHASDAGRIRHALRPVGLNRPDAFLQSISTLIDMRNRL